MKVYEAREPVCDVPKPKYMYACLVCRSRQKQFKNLCITEIQVPKTVNIFLWLKTPIYQSIFVAVITSGSGGGPTGSFEISSVASACKITKQFYTEVEW